MDEGADFIILVFEGSAHPFKENFVKIDGRLRRAEVPDVKTEALKSLAAARSV